VRRVAMIVLLVVLAAACDSGSSTSMDTSSSIASSTASPTVPVATTNGADLPPITGPPYYGPPWTVTDDGMWVSEDPAWREPGRYAGEVGITIEEARRRNLLVEEALVLLERPLTERLEGAHRRQLQRRYAGLWVEENPDGWWLMLALTPASIDPEVIVNGLVGGTALEGLMVLVEAEFSMRHLKEDLRAANRATNTCDYYDNRVEIDERSNRVVVRVHSTEDFQATGTDHQVAAIPSALVVEDPLEGSPRLPRRCEIPPAEDCPCLGCAPRATLTVGDQEVEAILWFGEYLECEPQSVPTTAVAVDGPGPQYQDRIEVPPGTEMTLTVIPWHPEMTVAVAIDPGHPPSDWISPIHIDPIDDNSWTMRAPQKPGRYILSVTVHAPRADSYLGFMLVVTLEDDQ